MASKQDLEQFLIFFNVPNVESNSNLITKFQSFLSAVTNPDSVVQGLKIYYITIMYVALARALFLNYDKNEDGVIDSEELQFAINDYQIANGVLVSQGIIIFD